MMDAEDSPFVNFLYYFLLLYLIEIFQNAKVLGAWRNGIYINFNTFRILQIRSKNPS